LNINFIRESLDIKRINDKSNSGKIGRVIDWSAKAPLLGKGGVAAVSADGVVR
jgi:hypothetical protein